MLEDIDVTQCQFHSERTEGCYCFNTKEECYAINPGEHNRCDVKNCYFKMYIREVKERKLAVETMLYFRQALDNMFEIARRKAKVDKVDLDNLNYCHHMIEHYFITISKMEHAVDEIMTNAHGERCNYYREHHIKHLVDKEMLKQEEKLNKLKKKLIKARDSMPFYNSYLQEAIEILCNKEDEEEDNE